MDYKSFGILSIVITWLGLFFVLHKWPGNKSMSFSQHVALKRVSQIYYFLLFAVTLPLFFLFIYNWFVPQLKLPAIFIILATLGTLLQLVAVIVPETKGLRVKIHRTSAFGMSLCLLVMAILLIQSPEISLAARMTAILSSMYMLVTWYLFIFSKFLQAHFLYFQAIYVALFHITILTSTYLR